jgi:hypothetical protein
LGLGRSALERARHLRDLSGGLWEGWRRLAIDVAIAIPFWGVWELTACFVHLAVEPVHAPTATYQPLTGRRSTSTQLPNDWTARRKIRLTPLQQSINIG